MMTTLLLPLTAVYKSEGTSVCSGSTAVLTGDTEQAARRQLRRELVALAGEKGRAAARHLLLPALPVVLLVGVGGDGSALGSCTRVLKGERRQACRQRRQGGRYPGVLSGARAGRPGPGPCPQPSKLCINDGLAGPLAQGCTRVQGCDSRVPSRAQCKPPSAALNITQLHTCRHGAIGACLCPQTFLLALRDLRGVYLVVHGCCGGK